MVVVLIFLESMYFYGANIQDFFIPYLSLYFLIGHKHIVY